MIMLEPVKTGKLNIYMYKLSLFTELGPKHKTRKVKKITQKVITKHRNNITKLK